MVKTGYIFAGWNTAADGDGTDYAAGSNLSISENVILYAKWIDINNQTTLEAVTVENLNDITVKKGTDIDHIDLPETVDVTLSNSTTSAAVTWDDGEPDYDGNVVGTYIFTGDLSLLNGVTNPSNLEASVKVIVKKSSSSSSSSSSSKSKSSKEKITVKVTDGSSNGVVGQATIERVTTADGTKQDTVTYEADKARETIEKLLSEGKDIAKIVATDNNSKVSQTLVNIPKDTLSVLSNGNVNLEIETNGVTLSIKGKWSYG